MDDFELERALEEAQKNVRCINCIYYQKDPGTLVAYALCFKSGETKKFNEYCWQWSTVEWDWSQIETENTTYAEEESIMSQEYRIRELLKNGLSEISGVTVTGYGTLHIKYRNGNFPIYTIKHQDHSDTFNVSLEIGGVKTKTIYSLHDEEDAYEFIQLYRRSLNLRARRRR